MASGLGTVTGTPQNRALDQGRTSGVDRSALLQQRGQLEAKLSALPWTAEAKPQRQALTEQLKALDAQLGSVLKVESVGISLDAQPELKPVLDVVDTNHDNVASASELLTAAKEALAAAAQNPQAAEPFKKFAETLGQFANGMGPEANLMKALAAKLDKLGRPDSSPGEVSRTEVLQFISSCAAKADQASRAGNPQEAANQQTLMNLGKALLKMVP